METNQFYFQPRTPPLSQLTHTMPNGFHLDILLREEFTEKYLLANDNLLRIDEVERKVKVRVGVDGNCDGKEVVMARVFNWVSFIDRIAALSGCMTLDIDTDPSSPRGLLQIDSKQIQFADCLGLPESPFSLTTQSYLHQLTALATPPSKTLIMN